jgi:phosphate:Na+ symporter
LPVELSDYPGYLFHMMNEVERIGDHAENIVEMSQAYATDDVMLSRGAIKDVKETMVIISKMSKLVVSVMEIKSDEKIEEILKLNDDYKNKKKEILVAHEKRITTGDCMPFAGIFFIDLIDNLSSVVTHLRHIARSIQRRKVIS